MMGKIIARAAFVLFVLVMLFQWGCAGRSKEARFYVLSATASSGINAAEAKSVESDISIAVSPIVLPRYLQRPQIVTRTGSNELHLAEFDRWAGKMSEDMGRVIAENLANLLPTAKVFSGLDMETSAPDYTVQIIINRFDGRLGSDLELDARWIILDSQGNTLNSLNYTHIAEPTGSSSYANMVAAQSRALGAFSRDLAAAIKGLTGS